MGNPPAYQYYAADFDEDTASWNNEEVGIYQRLLNYSWINGWTPDEGLPDDPKRLALIVRCSYKKFQKRWEIISKKFSRNGSGFLVNRRMEEGREKLLKYIESQRESGKRGAEKRWEKDGDPIADSISKPIDEPNGEKMALPSSISKEEKKEIKERKKEPQKPGDFFSKTELPEVERHCKTLTTYFKKNFWPWIQSQIKKKYRADAIIFSLAQLWEYRKSTKDPWPYLNQIIVIEHQNRNEAEHMAEHEKLKREETDGSIPEFFK